MPKDSYELPDRPARTTRPETTELRARLAAGRRREAQKQADGGAKT